MKTEYSYEDMIYVGKKTYFLTPGRTYRIQYEYIYSLINPDKVSFTEKSYFGDDGLIRTIQYWSKDDPIKFVTKSEWREIKINEILK